MALDGLLWVAVDWGTTHMRAWAVAGDGSVLSEARSDRGMGVLARDDFEPALLAMIDEWLPETRTIPVIACGMVGARQGWTEAAYRPVPASPLAAELFKSAPAADRRITVSIIPGIMQVDPSDVMRGEETQIAGFLADRPDFDGMLCLPGTHTKWVRISGGSVVAFTSCMTGELFSLLESQSVLRHSVGTCDIDGASFEATVAAVLRDPASIPATLFSIRARDLLKQVPAEVSRATLSATLVGAEIAAMRSVVTGLEVIVLGDPNLSELYRIALSVDGVHAETISGSAMSLKGLFAAKTLLDEMS